MHVQLVIIVKIQLARSNVLILMSVNPIRVSLVLNVLTYLARMNVATLTSAAKRVVQVVLNVSILQVRTFFLFKQKVYF